MPDLLIPPSRPPEAWNPALPGAVSQAERDTVVFTAQTWSETGDFSRFTIVLWRPQGDLQGPGSEEV